MQFMFFLVSTFLSLLPLSADDKGIVLSYTTLSTDTITSSDKYKSLAMADIGHHKTLIRVEKYPHVNALVFKIKRPLLQDQQNEFHVTLKELAYNASLIGESIPSQAISSKGFFPGEKLSIVVETLQGGSKSETLTIIPQPLVAWDRQGKASLSAELALLTPTNYLLKLEGFKQGEKIRFISRSAGEKLEHEMAYNATVGFFHSPEVIGQKGGICEIQIIRENSERIVLSIPWGTEVKDYFYGKREPVITSFPAISSKQKTL